MLVRLENRRLVVKTQYDGQLLGFMRSLPDARWDKAKRMWTCAATPYTVRRIADRGGFELHNDVARLGKKWFDGSEVDDPIGPSLYGVSPWRHQKRMYDFSYLRIAAYLAAEMGCGKSAAAVWLLENTFASNAIIVCPKAVLGVWPREFARHARDRTQRDARRHSRRHSRPRDPDRQPDSVDHPREDVATEVVGAEVVCKPGLPERSAHHEVGAQRVVRRKPGRQKPGGKHEGKQGETRGAHGRAQRPDQPALRPAPRQGWRRRRHLAAPARTRGSSRRYMPSTPALMST